MPPPPVPSLPLRHGKHVTSHLLCPDTECYNTKAHTHYWAPAHYPRPPPGSIPLAIERFPPHDNPFREWNCWRVCHEVGKVFESLDLFFLQDFGIIQLRRITTYSSGYVLFAAHIYKEDTNIRFLQLMVPEEWAGSI